MAQKSSRILGILLFFSLLANAGAATQFYMDWQAEREQDTVMLSPLTDEVKKKQMAKVHPAQLPKRQSVLDALPEEKKQIFLQLREKAQKKLAEEYKTLKSLREGMFDVLAAEPFSEEKFHEQMEAVITAKAKIHRIQAEPLAIFAKKLTADERDAFIGALRSK